MFQLSAAQKRRGARQFEHWYYTTDLGDGVTVQMTGHDDPRAIMAGVDINKNIAIGVFTRNFGPLKGKTILDLGCSAGYHSFEMASLGANVTGIDHDPQAIKQAKFVAKCRKIRGVSFYRENLFQSKIRDGLFDYVYCSGTLYHIADQLGAVKRIFSWCTEGAVISSSIIAGNEMMAQLNDHRKFSCGQKGEYALIPTAPLLRHLFEFVGFEVIEMASMCDYGSMGEPPANRIRTDWSTVNGPAYFALKKGAKSDKFL